MAVSSNYSRSVIGGSDYNNSRSVLYGSDEDYSRSVLGGSDYVDETPCEPCQNEGKNTTAVKYCTDCVENLCGPCSKHHVSYNAFRHHVIKDVEAVKPDINKDGTEIIDKSTDQLAKLEISSKLVQRRPGHVMSSSGAIRNVTANRVSTIDISTSNDNESPIINDLSVVQTHYYVVTDDSNKSVNVVDTRTRCVISQIQISYADYGCVLTSVNDDQVAVAVKIKDVRKILLFSVSASGIISDTHKSIDVNAPYITGLTHSNDRFHASLLGEKGVISMQGQIITTFTNESFSKLRGIALGNDHNTLYVCSWGINTVFRVDLNGNVTASYNDLMSPWGITVDSDGYVYACSPGSVCVHQLTANLDKVQLIITEYFVWSVACNKNGNSLSLGIGNIIKVYDLTYY